MMSVLTNPHLVRRDRRTAVGILALGALVIAVGLTGDVTFAGVRSPWWHLLPAVIGVAAVTVQRRFPWPVLAVAIGCSLVDLTWGWSLPAIVVLWEVLYTASLAWPWPYVERLRQVAVVVAVGVALVAGIVATDVQSAANAGLLGFAVLVMPLWWGTDLRRQTDLRQLAERNVQQERHAAVRDERATMARDLHDAIAGDLASIAIQAEAGLRTAKASTPEHSALTAIRASGLRGVDELTRMITLLRREGDNPAEDVVTAPGLGEVGELVDHARRTGLRVESQITLPDGLPLAVDHAAYRIVQESLTNASRHGGAEARVSVGAVDGQVRVVVRSRGAGARVPGSGLGLLTMRERAEGLGGRFESGWDAAEPDWWRVEAWIPWRSVTR